jgi:hypothetical protein
MNHEQRDLLERVHNAGIKLRIEGDRVLYRAPAGAMTADLRRDLIAWKPALVDEYNERAGILQYDANMPRDEAERKAAAEVLTPPKTAASVADGTGIFPKGWDRSL